MMKGWLHPVFVTFVVVVALCVLVVVFEWWQGRGPKPPR
jgi:hypothetical protein